MLLQEFALRALDALDDVGAGPLAVVGEHREGRDELQQRHLVGPQGGGGVGPELGGDAEAPGGVDDLRNPDVAGQLDGGHVAGLGQGLAVGHHAAVLHVDVVGRVGSAAHVDGEGGVVDGVVGGPALQQGRGVDEGLEDRPGLALGLGGPVEFRLFPTGAAHHGPDGAGLRLDGQEGALDERRLVEFDVHDLPAAVHGLDEEDGQVAPLEEVLDIRFFLGAEGLARELPGDLLGDQVGGVRAERNLGLVGPRVLDQPRAGGAGFGLPVPVGVPVGGQVGGALGQHVFQVAPPALAAVVGAQAVAHGLLGGVLEGHVQRGVDPQAAGEDLLVGVALLQVLPDVFQEIAREVAVEILGDDGDGLPGGVLVVPLGDVAVLEHLLEDDVPAGERVVGVVDGRVAAGALHDGGQQGALGQGHLLGRLVEEELGGRGDAVVAVPHVDLVGVEGEDGVLRVVLLDLDGQQRLLDLPLELDVGGEEEQLAELLGDGARPAHDLAVPQVDGGRGDDPADVDAHVVVETLVLDGDDGQLEVLGDLAGGNELAPLEEELADGLAVPAVDLGQDGGLVVFQGPDFGQVDHVAVVQADGDAGRSEDEQDETVEDPEQDVAGPGTLAGPFRGLAAGRRGNRGQTAGRSGRGRAGRRRGGRRRTGRGGRRTVPRDGAGARPRGNRYAFGRGKGVVPRMVPAAV